MITLVCDHYSDFGPALAAEKLATSVTGNVIFLDGGYNIMA